MRIPTQFVPRFKRKATSRVVTLACCRRAGAEGHRQGGTDAGELLQRIAREKPKVYKAFRGVLPSVRPFTVPVPGRFQSWTKWVLDKVGGKVIGIDIDFAAVQRDVGKDILDALGQLLIVAFESLDTARFAAAETELDPAVDKSYFVSKRQKLAVTNCRNCILKQRIEPRPGQAKPWSRPDR